MDNPLRGVESRSWYLPDESQLTVYEEVDHYLLLFRQADVLNEIARFIWREAGGRRDERD